MNDKFRKSLKRGEDKIHTDQKNMTEWQVGKIGTTVLFMRVCENNGIPEEYQTDTMEDFEKWVRGLGYGV